MMAEKGAGKSYDITDEAIKWMRKKEYVAIRARLTLPPDVDPQYYIYFDDIADVMFKRKLHIVIEEGVIGFDAREFASMPPTIRQWLVMQRHYQQHVVLISQQLD